MAHQPARDHAIGRVYLVRCDDIYKIGFSTNPVVRLNATKKESRDWLLARGHDSQLMEITHTITTNNMAMVEQELHRRFDHKRLEYGYPCEWFNLSSDDVTWICSIAHWNVEMEVRERHRIAFEDGKTNVMSYSWRATRHAEREGRDSES